MFEFCGGNAIFRRFLHLADVAELADALGSGFSAPRLPKQTHLWQKCHSHCSHRGQDGQNGAVCKTRFSVPCYLRASNAGIFITKGVLR